MLMKPAEALLIVLIPLLYSASVEGASIDDRAQVEESFIDDYIDDEYSDDTPDVETDGSIDTVIDESIRGRLGWVWSGDLRVIATHIDFEDEQTNELDHNDLGTRARVDVSKKFGEKVRLNIGAAARCFYNECNLEFVQQPEIPSPNGLTRSQATFDELYLHWFHSGQKRFDVVVGRIQTRFVLRGGVFAKSLDRNDSNNSRVTWTDGIHATLRGRSGWRSNFIIQRNSKNGSGSIRHEPLDFDDSGARNSYFIGFENLQPWGHVVQRGLDITYLPKSLLKDNTTTGRRVDYWGVVGRLVVRYPQDLEGFRFRGGLEVGYAPDTPTRDSVRSTDSGDTDGLAWNIILDGIDIKPGHSLGVNYGRTGKGWLLSPQYFPDSTLFELRYQWKIRQGPIMETRVRWQEEQHNAVASLDRRAEFDFYLRFTWEFGR